MNRYVVANDTLYSITNDGRGDRWNLLLDGVSKIDPNSQHGKCLADAGITRNGCTTGKRVIAIGDRYGVTAYDASTMLDATGRPG